MTGLPAAARSRPTTPFEPALQRDLIDTLVGFGRTLRHAGVPASADRVQAMISALAHLDVLDANQVYWAGRLTLCADPADFERYDRAFAFYFGARQDAHRVASTPPTMLRAAPFEAEGAAATGEPVDDQPSFAVRASRAEMLRHKDLGALTPAERDQLRRLFQLLAPRATGRRSRRRAPASRGEVDLRRTLQQLMRDGGEPSRLLHRRRTSARRRLVLLIDVSGSMAPYADSLLRFGHAACRAAPTNTEVFTVGTRLTRVTRELRLRDPDHALAAAGRAVPDWSGGTRLGDALKAFLDLWGQRGLARGAVVVLCSDGWERGDPAELGRQVARLARLARAVVWVNPHKGRAGFSPATGGMLAALPHIDTLVAGHSFAALEQLVTVIADA